ncbi:hypothetical protein CHI12_06640, partial [Terribacillus saccharophilus]
KSIKQYEILDTIIKKEMELFEDTQRFPFTNTIRQFSLALFITGLLSYSLKEIIGGNSQLGISLLTLYLTLLGTIIIVASLVYVLRDFTNIYKLKNLSKLVSELQLRNSIVDNELAHKRTRINKRYMKFKHKQ